MLMEQVWPGHHEIAWKMAIAVDVLLGCLQPMHALIPAVFLEGMER